MYLSAEIAQARVADLLRQAEDARRAREGRKARKARRAAPPARLARRTVVLPDPLADEVAPTVIDVTEVDAGEIVQVGR